MGTEEEEDFLLALVFLDMMLKSRRTDTKEIERKKKKEKSMADYKLAQKYIEITVLYNAWIISTHDACSNAVRISSILL